jgi:aconitase B
VPLNLSFDVPYWVGVTVEPETAEMTPRLPLSTVPYSFRAAVATTLDNVLGSAELGAVASTMGKLPTVSEFMAVIKEKVEPNMEKIYRYLQFDEMPEYK